MNRILLGATALMMTLPATAQMQPPPVVAPPAPMAPMAPRMDMAQTRDQVVAKVRDHFAKMDVNRDGYVAGDEMKLADRRHGQSAEERKARRQQAAFDWLDRNRDNIITRAEFSSFRAPRGEIGVTGVSPPASIPRARFQGAGGWGGPGKGSRMMKLADLDRDGRVSLQEATTSALQRFDRVDANRDGRITPDERRQQREQRRALRGQRAG